MRKMKVLVALVLAMMMVLSLSAAFAATITVTPPTGVDATATNTYTFYKVFDAVNSGSGISYKLLPGKTTAPAGFTVDVAGNVYLGTVSTTATGASGEITIQVSEGGSTVTKYLVPQTTELTTDQIAAIAAYVSEQGLTGATATSTGSDNAVYTVPSDGYYYITTTTGTTITVDSTTASNVDVKDKNEVPSPEKKIFGVDVGSFDDDGKKALSEVGQDVDYRVTFEIKKGAKGYKFHDTMTAGLSYNNDVVVNVDGTPVEAGETTWATETAEGETLTIAFVDAYVAANVGKTVTIEYSAKVTSDALQTVPGKNTVKITYGNNSSYNSTEDSTETYNAKFTVTKHDGSGAALGGAGFVINNGTGYYKLNAATESAPAFITWYVLSEGETLEAAITAGKITQYVSDPTTGAVPSFTGLVDGTYTLIESQVPAGYNKAPDQTFTIAAHNYESTNLIQTATVVNNAGAELPSTGGIGTTIFYIAGIVLVLGAAAVMVARRKSEQ